MDEDLAVGEGAFARKCLEKMDELKREGKTIVVVGHHLPRGAPGDAAIFLEDGRVTAQGSPPAVVATYRGSMAEQEAYDA